MSSSIQVSATTEYLATFIFVKKKIFYQETERVGPCSVFTEGV